MRDVINISKPDHSSLFIETSPGIEAELGDVFSFMVPGHQFMPKYKYGIWDGKLRLFNARNKLLPAGLLYDLVKFGTERDYSIEFNNRFLPIHTLQKNSKYDLDIPISGSDGNPIEPRDYQIGAVNHVIKHRRNIILSPTGSGKSLIIYMLMRYFEDRVALLIVPTTALVEQMYKDFQDYSQKDDSYHVNEESVHRIYSGHDKDPPDTANVVITTWQSIYKQPASWFDNYEMVIGDEVHLFKAKSLTRIMDNCRNADIRIGTTGTLDGTEINKLVLKGLFGTVHTTTTTIKLMDENTLAKLHINAICLKHANKLAKCTYHEEVQHLVKDNKRNEFIAKLALSQKTNTLVLFNLVEDHGKPLFELIDSMNTDPSRKIFYTSGETNVLDRESIRAAMETETNAILVASFGTTSTGINIKNLHNIIFTSPTKSLIRVLQAIGRGLRKHGDSKLKLYDIIDDYSGNRKTKNYSYKHGIDRIKIYTKQKFKFKSHNINL